MKNCRCHNSPLSLSESAADTLCVTCVLFVHELRSCSRCLRSVSYCTMHVCSAVLLRGCRGSCILFLCMSFFVMLISLYPENNFHQMPVTFAFVASSYFCHSQFHLLKYLLKDLIGLKSKQVQGINSLVQTMVFDLFCCRVFYYK